VCIQQWGKLGLLEIRGCFSVAVSTIYTTGMGVILLLYVANKS